MNILPVGIELGAEATYAVNSYEIMLNKLKSHPVFQDTEALMFRDNHNEFNTEPSRLAVHPQSIVELYLDNGFDISIDEIIGIQKFLRFLFSFPTQVLVNSIRTFNDVSEYTDEELLAQFIEPEFPIIVVWLNIKYPGSARAILDRD